MAMYQTTYNQVRKEVSAGDVIAFGGHGKFSDVIKWYTQSPVSHVGIVIQSIADYHQIVESANIGGFSGVSINLLYERVRDYDGLVWWLPLSAESKACVNYPGMQEFLLAQLGKEYDLPQAIAAGFDAFDMLGNATSENFDKLFCSEIVGAALKIGGLVNLNPSEATPIDICELDIYASDYYQLKGKSRVLESWADAVYDGEVLDEDSA